MLVVQPSDFVGFFELAKSISTQPRLQAYIDTFEKSYIHQLLGVDMGDLFIVNLTNGVPTDARFLAIFNPFAEQPNNQFWYCSRHIWESKGIKFVLCCLIYYQYTFKTQLKASQSGTTLNKSEVSDVANPTQSARFAEQKWNEAIESIKAIEWFMKCSNNKGDYTDAKPVRFKTRYSSFI